MNLSDLNALPPEKARDEFARCCGSAAWVEKMIARRPFADKAAVMGAADEAWAAAGEKDWLEAFSHHPRIGGKDALRAKFASTTAWAQGEQAKVAQADENTLDALAEGNADYEARFGFIFIVCATGKTAPEMLALLKARLPNERGPELSIAAAEQHKITKIRLEKLLS